MATRLDADGRPLARARERILDTAYELFSRRGVRGVGIDEVIERAGVAKATLYRHFPSKDDLIIAFLDLREQRWTRNFVEAEVLSRAEALGAGCLKKPFEAQALIELVQRHAQVRERAAKRPAFDYFSLGT